MVLSMKDLEEALLKQSAHLESVLDSKIKVIKNEILDVVKRENLSIVTKVDDLNIKIVELEKRLETNHQYQRQTNCIS